MGAAWEVAGYVFRTLSIIHPLTDGLYTAQLLLILLAPLWMNAYAYMLLGRMVHLTHPPPSLLQLTHPPQIHCFLPKGQDRIFKIRARSITRMFVWFDITAFIVQATGGTMTSPGNSNATQNNGLHIYTGGVGLQLFFLVIFVSLAIGFQQRLKTLSQTSTASEHIPLDEEANPPSYTKTGGQWPSYFRTRSNSPAGCSRTATGTPPFHNAKILLGIIYVTLALLIFRNIYRLAEFGTGINSPTVKHEWFAYVFDAVPMFAVLVILNVFNPGRYLWGERCSFAAENREIKQAKKQKKLDKKNEKRARKEERVQMKIARKEGRI
jgi:hypothetical protein